MWKLIYKDIVLSKKPLVIILIYAVVFPLIFNSNDSGLNSSMGSLILVGFTFFITAIEIEERAKSFRIIHSLPVTRKESVVARYVGSLILSVLSILALNILYLGLSNFMSIAYKLTDYKSMVNCMMAIISTSSIVMVLTYALGYNAARIANFLLFFPLFIIYTGLFSGSSNEFLNNISSFANNIGTSMLTLKIIIAFLIYLLSMMLSIFIYEQRDL